jgi:hypothetical protein
MPMHEIEEWEQAMNNAEFDRASELTKGTMP